MIQQTNNISCAQLLFDKDKNTSHLKLQPYFSGDNELKLFYMIYFYHLCAVHQWVLGGLSHTCRASWEYTQLPWIAFDEGLLYNWPQFTVVLNHTTNIHHNLILITGSMLNLSGFMHIASRLSVLSGLKFISRWKYFFIFLVYCLMEAISYW